MVQAPGFIRGINPKSKIENPQERAFIRGDFTNLTTTECRVRTHQFNLRTIQLNREVDREKAKFWQRFSAKILTVVLIGDLSNYN